MTVLYEPRPDAARGLAALLGGALWAGDAVRAAATADEVAARLAADPREPLIVAGPGAPAADALRIAAELRTARPWTGVVLLCADADADLLRDALRAGIREIADPRDPAGVRDACTRALEVARHLAPPAVPVGDTAPAGDGKIVTVVGTKGGCGRTTLATNLAVTLAAGGGRGVLIVDLDVQMGDVAVALQLHPERGIGDAVTMADRLDETGLRSLLTHARPGLDALLAPVRPTDGEHVGGALAGEVLRLARGMFDHVVVDTPAHFSDPLLAALEITDHTLLMAAPDVLTLKNTRVALETLDLLGHPAGRRTVVLNRSGSPVGLTMDDVEHILRVPIGAHIPSSADVPASLNKGVPLTAAQPRHAVSRAISDLAVRHLNAVPAPAASGRGRRRGLRRKEGS
ncbi:AAA family ATPase [Spirillospora albida]|uniref:AAA family ATPase n=1 Tax=Spirillospora albida TaxID=58123 RepID=UPI00068DC12A|nr:AAA family ATPase [Spirillospora albida]